MTYDYDAAVETLRRQEAVDLKAVTAKLIAELRPTYELVYVDYRDALDEEQVAALIRGDRDKLDESLEEFEFESRWQSVKYIVDELVKDLLDEDEAAAFDNDVESFDEVRYAIEERDESDPLRDLARNSGNVLLRITGLDEDDAYSFEEVDPVDCLTKLRLPTTEANVDKMRDVLAECSPEYSVLMGFYLAAVNIIDIYDLPAEGKVRITNPYVWMGNPFAGSGYADGPFEGEVIVDRADLRTDKDAWGYSWTEVADPVISYYEAKIEALDER